MMAKEPYLRWEPVIAEVGCFRGDNFKLFNKRMFEYIHQMAIDENLKTRSLPNGDDSIKLHD